MPVKSQGVAPIDLSSIGSGPITKMEGSQTSNEVQAYQKQQQEKKEAMTVDTKRFSTGYKNAVDNGYTKTKNDFAKELASEGYEVQGFDAYKNKLAQQTYLQKTSQNFNKRIGSFMDGVRQSAVKRDEKMEDIENNDANQSMGDSFLQRVGSSAGLFSNVLGSAFKNVLGFGYDELPEGYKAELDKKNAVIMNDPITKDVMEKLGQGVKYTSEQRDEFKGQNPVGARNIEAIFDIGSLSLDISGGIATGKSLVKGGKAVLSTADDAIKATTKAVGNASEIIAGKVDDIKGGTVKAFQGLKDGNFIENGVEKIAKTVSKTSTPSDMLFKAQSPRLNQLNKNFDIKNLKANAEIANNEILKAGFTPTNTSERVKAHMETMNKIWKTEIASKISDKANIDLSDVADSIETYVKEQSKAGIVKNNTQLNDLLQQAQAYKKMGSVDGSQGEFVKQMLNAQINNRGDSSIGDVYKNGLKGATKLLGTKLDDAFSVIPGEFSDAKRRFGAMKSTFEDVFKADIKNARRMGDALDVSWSRIEGFGDLLGSFGSLITGKNPIPKLAEGGAKIILGKVAGKLKDPDYLIQQGFEGLKNTMK